MPRKSKLLEQLDAANTQNPYLFAGRGNVYVVFVAATKGRGSRGAYFSVVRPGFMTDPNAHWMDNGCKTFSAAGRKAEALAEALAWAGERYKITDWAKTPFGSWMSADVIKARLAELLPKEESKSK